MPRVEEAEVREIIDTEVESLTAFITVANQLVTAKLVGVGYSDEQLKEIERWLAAHFVAVRDPRVRQRTVGDAKETYALSGGYKPGLDSTPYGQQVAMLDYQSILVSQLGKTAVIFDAVEEDYT